MFTLIFHSILLFLLVFLCKKYYQKQALGEFFILGFLAKIGAGIAFSWLYLYYYGSGDMQNYFQHSSALANIAYQDFSAYSNTILFNEYVAIPNFDPQLWVQTRTLFFIKFLSVFNLLSGGSFWALTNYLSFFSFLGMWHLATILTKLYPKTKYASLLAFIFFPSMLIWSVGISKESIVMGIIAFILARIFLLQIEVKRTWLWWFLSIFIWFLSAILLLFIKFYYLGVLLPCILAYILTKKLSKQVKLTVFKKTLPQFGLFLVLIVVIYYPISFTNPYLSLENAMRDICYNHNSSYVFSKQNDLIHYWRINNTGFITLYQTYENFAKNAPIALYSGLFRPFIWESDNKLKMVLSLENFFVLLLSIFALYYWVKKGKKEFNLIILACIFYIFVLCIILAFSSPNFGTLARYKVGFKPVFIYLISIPFSILWGSFLDKKLRFLKRK